MSNPHQVTKDFERALCEYTGAQFAVAVNSCTAALLLSVAWHLRNQCMIDEGPEVIEYRPTAIEIPKRTYVSVGMAIIHAKGRPTFRDEEWRGAYQLKPLPVWDSARWFTSGMCIGMSAPNIYTTPFRNVADQMVCVSFHASKTLGIEQGGAILHDNPEADAWLRRARFDGRTEGVAPKGDTFTQIGWHCYLNPSTAAQGLLRLHSLPKHNEPLPNDEYPSLDQLEIFK